MEMGHPVAIRDIVRVFNLVDVGDHDGDDQVLDCNAYCNKQVFR